MRVYAFNCFSERRGASALKNSVQRSAFSDQKNQARPPKRSRLWITGFIALFTAGASAWLMLSSSAIHCDSLAPLTVLATLAAFLISICFRQMGRFTDRRSRWFLLVCILIAGGTLFADFRFVRSYRDFCDQMQQQMRQSQPSR